jgi:hypothetical protein
MSYRLLQPLHDKIIIGEDGSGVNKISPVAAGLLRDGRLYPVTLKK